MEGIGYAVQYGIIEPKPEALDHITSTEEFEALAKRGHDANQAETDRRMAEIRARPEPIETEDE